MFYYFSPNKSLSVTEKGDLARLALLTGMQRNLDTCAHAHAHEYCHRKICKLWTLELRIAVTPPSTPRLPQLSYSTG